MNRNRIDILDDKAQEGMRKVCRLAREVLDIAAAAVKPGVTTDFIDKIVHNACIERKVGFQKITMCVFLAHRNSHTRLHSITTISPSLYVRRPTRSSVMASLTSGSCLMATYSTST